MFLVEKLNFQHNPGLGFLHCHAELFSAVPEDIPAQVQSVAAAGLKKVWWLVAQDECQVVVGSWLLV